MSLERRLENILAKEAVSDGVEMYHATLCNMAHQTILFIEEALSDPELQEQVKAYRENFEREQAAANNASLFQ